jgi:flagellar motor switch protein FliN/FliY
MTPLDLAGSAGAAAAAVLPAPAPLTVGTPAPGDQASTAGHAGAVVTDLQLPGTPRIAVLVGGDLVEALAGSPLGGLDLAAAVQPALDAAAAALGTTAGPARTTDLDLVLHDLEGPFHTVPLVEGSGIGAALLLADAALRPAAAEPVPAPLVAAPGFGDLTAQPVAPAPLPAVHRGIEMLHGVDMEVTVEIGRTRMTVRDLLALAPGAVLELDRAAGSPADLLVNGRLIARGEVVVVDEDFGLRVTEILDESAAS